MAPEDLTPGIVLKWLRLQSTKYADAAKRYHETATKFLQAAEVVESVVEPAATSGANAGIHTGASAGIQEKQGGVHTTPAPHTRLFKNAAGSKATT